MTQRRPSLQWSDGAAGPLLRLADLDPGHAVWEDFAACKDTDVEAFYVEKGESTKDAKALCARCPVQPQCLEYALDHMDLRDPRRNHGNWGVWGGTSLRERQRIKHERKQAA